MEAKDYIVSKIEGEYAHLTDINTNDALFIALALLPEGTDEGSHIHFEMFEYTLLNP